MGNKTIKEPKQPKTVRVSTVIYGVVAIALIGTAFVAGWHSSQQYEHALDSSYRQGAEAASKDQR